MTDFNYLCLSFSADDEGAQELTEEEFLDLSREYAKILINHVKNATISSYLQKIYDTANPISQGKFILVRYHGFIAAFV